MANRFKGKICLVTGSTAGIGYGIALRFAQEGAEAVIICSRKKSNVEDAVNSISKECPSVKIDGLVCNVGQKD